MEQPKAPDTPLSSSDHFQSDQRIAEGMQAPGNPLGGPSEAESYGRQDVDEAFDIFMDLEQDDNDMGDPTAASSAMEAALIAAGTHRDAAKLFVNKIVGNAGATTFMEMYGQGTIVSEANRTRRSLNCEGLRAFDLRTNKPDGCPWNFNKSEDRKLARQMIADDDPEWIIGSPPCTAFSIWNRQMNYRKMPVDKVRAAIEEVKDTSTSVVTSIVDSCNEVSISCMSTRLWLSWVHPQMAAICKMHGVHLVTADQCMYGLETPSATDGSPAPAMKPTRHHRFTWHADYKNAATTVTYISNWLVGAARTQPIIRCR